MRLILDAGALSGLAEQPGKLAELRQMGLWPGQIPAAVLAEGLTGDHRRDFRVNRIVAACLIEDVDEPRARAAARLRTATGRAGTISAVDALVAAAAEAHTGSLVLTSDPKDLRALAEHARSRFRVQRV